MSLDLSWTLLDEDFTSHLRTTLDKALHHATRPDFIGPIHLSALHLGNEAPEVSIVDIGDVWQGFLDRSQVDDAALQGKRCQTRPSFHNNSAQQSSHDHFAKFAERNLPFTAVDQGDRHTSRRNKAGRLQTFRQYSDSGNAQLVETGSVSSFDATLSVPQTPASSHWGPGLTPADRPFSSRSSNAGGYFPAWQGATPSVGQRPAPLQRSQSWRRSSASVHDQHRHPSTRAPTIDGRDAEEPSSSTTSAALPSLQLHLSLHWNTSSIRITLATSLLINHPSPAFMSLPLSITITGLVLQAGGLLAFEVDQVTNVRRGHFCLVVEEEEEGEEQQEEQEGEAEQGQASLPPLRMRPAATPSTGTGFGFDQQMTPGERILSNVTLETSVGQADKHVLRNVAKVERFVVSLVRKAIGDEVS
jgi:distribution and morphology protein 12